MTRLLGGVVVLGAVARDVAAESCLDDVPQRLAARIGDGLRLGPHVSHAEGADRGLPSRRSSAWSHERNVSQKLALTGLHPHSIRVVFVLQKHGADRENDMRKLATLEITATAFDADETPTAWATTVTITSSSAPTQTLPLAIGEDFTTTSLLADATTAVTTSGHVFVLSWATAGHGRYTATVEPHPLNRAA